MNKRQFPLLILLICLILACRVVLITGYDPVIDELTTKIKRDFNLHFIKLSRTLQDSDPANQDFKNFQDYYDNLETDLVVLTDRAQVLDKKSSIVKMQIANLDSAFQVFVNSHRKGLPDRSGDDRKDIRNGLNSSIDAVIRLQEALKTTGKTE